MYFSLMPNEFFVLCAAIFGAASGSFFHVCVLRIPQEKSIVYPSSRCPQCQSHIPWYDNLPILSYLILRGKSRCCNSPIPIRYLIYELLTAVLFASIVWHYKFTNTAILYLFVISILVISCGIDWDHFYIPDRFSLPMIPLSIAAALAAQYWQIFPSALVQTLTGSIAGIVLGGGFIWLIRIVGSWVFQQEAMGFGDVKLMAYLGGFLGWQNSIVCLFLAFLIGSIVGVTLKYSGKIGKYGHIPFGPYLALGAYLALLFGPDIIRWYLEPFQM